MRRNRESGRVWQVRRGAIAIKAAVLIFFVLIGMVALAIDVGFIVLTRTEAQVVADASSLAAGTALLPGLGMGATATHDEVEAAAESLAQRQTLLERLKQRWAKLEKYAGPHQIAREWIEPAPEFNSRNPQ